MRDSTLTTFRELIDAGYLQVGDGYRTKQAEHGQPGLPILRVAEVLDGRIDPKFEDFVSDDYRPAMGSKVSRPRDIVLTTKGTVGRVAMMPSEGPEFVYSPQVCFFRTMSTGPLVGQYLYYWFKSEQFWSQARSLKGQTDMADYINLADIRSLRILLQPKQVQQSIGTVLGALDDKIAVNDRIGLAHEELLRCLFQELRIDVEDESAHEISVSELIEFNPRTRAIRSRDAVYLDMSAVPTNSARVRGWSRREPKSGARFINNDTVMARITPCLENGKVAFVDFMDEGEVGVGLTEFIVMRAKTGLPIHLPYFLARSPRFQNHAIRNMVGSSGRQRVGAGQLTDFPIRRPDHNELAEFGTATSIAFRHIKSLDAESQTLTELRDVLLPRLMSGEIRVQDAERIVEDAM